MMRPKLGTEVGIQAVLHPYASRAKSNFGSAFLDLNRVRYVGCETGLDSLEG
jgi:hypothetical protein